tara:strand:- start:321 stop:1418 length:1098 start_codon:yes stop_codon:yes gene_type:complete
MSKAAELAALIGSGQAQGDKNLIINGAMQVAQRGTSATGVGASDNVYPCVDRIKVFAGNTAGRATMSQATDVHDGFSNALKFECTTADTSIAAGEYFGFKYEFEGQDLQQLKKGTSEAESITLSFYVKGNAGATYTVEFKDNDNNRINTQTFAVTTSWNRVSLTLAPDTTGALDDDNASSFQFSIWLHAGSTYTSGTFANNTWAARTNGNRVSSSQTSFFDSTSRTFFITGIQLEVGDVATPFEHRSFGDELARCQRYFTRIPRIDGSSANTEIANGMGNATNNFLGVISFPTEMRANPTLTASGSFRVFNGGTLNPTAGPSRSSSSTVGTGISVSTGAGISTKDALLLTLNNDSDANLQFSAEL